jgi:hypothetical protein
VRGGRVAWQLNTCDTGWRARDKRESTKRVDHAVRSQQQESALALRALDSRAQERLITLLIYPYKRRCMSRNKVALFSLSEIGALQSVRTLRKESTKRVDHAVRSQPGVLLLLRALDMEAQIGA